MISSNALRPGVTVEYRQAVWQVIDAMHVKPGKGSAFVQTKWRNLATGDVLSVNFRAGERLAAATIEKLKLVFIYRDSDQSTVAHDGTFHLNLPEEPSTNPVRDLEALFLPC